MNFTSRLAITRLVAALFFVAVLTACGKVTPENYARITDGMSEAEVIAILGKPTDSSAVALLGLTGSNSTWTGSEYRIQLQFVNGKVRARTLARVDAR